MKSIGSSLLARSPLRLVEFRYRNECRSNNSCTRSVKDISNRKATFLRQFARNRVLPLYSGAFPGSPPPGMQAVGRGLIAHPLPGYVRAAFDPIDAGWRSPGTPRL